MQTTFARVTPRTRANAKRVWSPFDTKPGRSGEARPVRRGRVQRLLRAIHLGQELVRVPVAVHTRTGIRGAHVSPARLNCGVLRVTIFAIRILALESPRVARHESLPKNRPAPFVDCARRFSRRSRRANRRQSTWVPTTTTQRSRLRRSRPLSRSAPGNRAARTDQGRGRRARRSQSAYDLGHDGGELLGTGSLA